MTTIHDPSQRYGIKLNRQNFPNSIIALIEGLCMEMYGDFEHQIVKPVSSHPERRAGAWEREIFEQKNEPLYLDLLRLAYVYAKDAKQLEEEEKYEDCWLHISFSQYWLGIGGAGRHAQEAVKDLRIQQARAAQRTKDAQYDAVREYAAALAQQKNYKSRRQATFDIQDRVIEHCKQLQLKPLTAQNAQKTIDKWLKDKGIVFPPKNK